MTDNKYISPDFDEWWIFVENVDIRWTVWRLQGEKGIQGRAGPIGPVGIGEPGLPVSMKMVL